MEKLIGRTTELAELERCYNSPRSEFVIIAGRRRIGKTFLVNRAFSGRLTFSFVGSHKSPKARQLKRFAQSLVKFGLCTLEPSLNNWYDAFDALERLLGRLKHDFKKVLFIDEMPWIDTQGSEFVAALEDFWNGWAAQRDDIMLIACGSATSWLVDNLIENQGGLHNRITMRLMLQPFCLQECKTYVEEHGGTWDEYMITQCYMCIGGVPFYWSLLDFNKDISSNIDALFFSPNARLRDEFTELFQVLFRESDAYTDIVRTLASHREGLTRQEIASILGANGGSLTARLTNLERCSLIKRQALPNGKKTGGIYRLVDFYTLFYLRFIEPVSDPVLPYWQSRAISPDILVWQGLTFELVGLTHIAQIKQALGIAGVRVEVGAWRGRDEKGRRAQVDLVIQRNDRVTHLCEFKFSTDSYTISADYATHLRDRMSIYREQTHTRDVLLTTFITTFGIRPGAHSSVAQYNLLLHHLFLPLMF